MDKRDDLTLEALLAGPPVLSVPHGGRYLGLGRTASYEAAKKGILPTILVGERRRVVPARRLAAMLGADDGAGERPT